MKHACGVGLYLLVTHVYDGGADTFDPDKLVREAVEDGDVIAAATIALEAYGWQLYAFIARQVQPNEVDPVFARVADEIVRGFPELGARLRVRDWIYTLVHGAWIRVQAGDPSVPLADLPAFGSWVQQVAEGYRAATAGLPRVRTAAGSGGLPRQLHASPAAAVRGRTPTRMGIERVAMQRLR